MKKNKRNQLAPPLHEVIKTYHHEDGSLNKLAIFISVLALVLVLVLGNAVVNSVKEHFGLSSVSASELSIDEIADEITNIYVDAVDEYVAGNMSQDELRQQIIKKLAALINSSNGFTEAQKIELNLAFEEYLNSTTIYEDIEKNNQSIEAIKKYIEEKYLSNREFIESTSAILTQYIENNSELDETRYNEIKQLLASINGWEGGDNECDAEGIKNELKALIDSLEKSVKELDESNTADHQELRDLISAISDSLSRLEAKTDASIKELEDKMNSSIANLDSKIDTSVSKLESNIANSSSSTNTTISNYFGISTWDPEINYSSSDYVAYNQKFYHSLINDNIGNEPASSPDVWSEVDVVTLIQMLQDQVNEIDAHISDVNNPAYKFQYGVDENGCAGYYVSGDFKPF